MLFNEFKTVMKLRCLCDPISLQIANKQLLTWGNHFNQNAGIQTLRYVQKMIKRWNLTNAEYVSFAKEIGSRGATRWGVEVLLERHELLHIPLWWDEVWASRRIVSKC